MKARRFTAAGMHVFTEFASSARAAFKRSELILVPEEMLTDPQLTAETAYVLPPGDVHFATKLDLGPILTGIIPDRDYDEVRLDAGWWSWLAAKYFDQLTNDRTEIKEERAYVAGLTFEEFYRHLLLGPYYLYYAARDDPSDTVVYCTSTSRPVPYCSAPDRASCPLICTTTRARRPSACRECPTSRMR